VAAVVEKLRRHGLASAVAFLARDRPAFQEVRCARVSRGSDS
jgi:hypothetical protein